MFPYQRLHDLFSYIYSNDVVLPAQAAKYLGVSVRTIRSDIIAINDTITNHGAEIILKRNYGYSIIVTNQELYNSFLKDIKKQLSSSIDLETAESRIRHITNILLLQNDYLSIDTISQIVYVSSTTLQNYLKTISKTIEKYNLEMINRSDFGVKIIGNEKAKRQCMIDSLHNSTNDDFVSVFSNEDYYFFQEYDLDKLKQDISDIFISHHIYITDLNLKNFVTHVALMLLRIKNDHFVNIQHINEINPHYQDLLSNIINYLENKYNVYINEGEKEYLYIHIVTNSNCNILEISDLRIDTFISSLLDCIYQDYSFDLRNDVILKEDLQKHMVSILSTKIINPNKKNPLLNTIKSNFPLPYEITLTSLQKVFKDTEFNLDEDDTGYISLHIGAAIERCFSAKFQAKNVILVCDGSHATARILEARLQNYYTNKINIVAIRSCSQIMALAPEDFNDIDFIIATSTIRISSCPIVIVDFTLKKQDIEAISKMINIIHDKSAKNNLNFFDENLFILNKPYQDKYTLLSDLSDLLYENDVVGKQFLERVIEREDLAKTNINDVFAFPHAMKYSAKKTKVAVALLDRPLKWCEDESVRIVFLLATKIEEQANIETLYNIVVEIVNNPSLQKRILKSNNYQDFINCLSQFS